MTAPTVSDLRTAGDNLQHVAAILAVADKIAGRTADTADNLAARAVTIRDANQGNDAITAAWLTALS